MDAVGFELTSTQTSVQRSTAKLIRLTYGIQIFWVAETFICSSLSSRYCLDTSLGSLNDVSTSQWSGSFSYPSSNHVYPEVRNRFLIW